MSSSFGRSKATNERSWPIAGVRGPRWRGRLGRGSLRCDSVDHRRDHGLHRRDEQGQERRLAQRPALLPELSQADLAQVLPTPLPLLRLQPRAIASTVRAEARAETENSDQCRPPAQEAERKIRVKEQEELQERLHQVREKEERETEAQRVAEEAARAEREAKRQATIEANGGYTDLQLIAFGVGNCQKIT